MTVKTIAVTSGEEYNLGTILEAHKADAPYKLQLSGDFGTAGTYEWGDAATRGPRLASSSSIELTGTIQLDPALILDDTIQDVPLHIICSDDGWAYGRSADDGWANVPRGELVKGGTLIANFSKIVSRFQAKNCMFRPSGVVLQGHAAAIEGVTFLDFGAWRNQGRPSGAEAFPGMIAGVLSGPDRDALFGVSLDKTFEEAHITDCTFDKYNPALSNDQVSCFVIIGGASNDKVADPWAEVGNWRWIWRDEANLLRNKVVASGQNLVQGMTLYECIKGLVSGNATPGVNVGYYGDFYSTKGVEISDNDFRRVWCAVRLMLSPTGPGAEQFSHENYIIQRNQYASSWWDVDTSELVAEWAQAHPDNPTPPAARYIRNIAVENAARVTSTSVGVTRFPLPGAKATGCGRFNPFRR